MPHSSKPGQIPLDFGHQSAAGREDLIVSDRLSAVVGLIDRWPDWPSPVVVVAGPTGSGKSHLASVWAEQAGAVRVQVNEADAGALAAATAGPVLVEDVDRSGLDETALFHLINTVRESGTTMMMTTRLWPAAWNVTLPDLASRLKAATTVEIGEPDDALLAQVLVKLFADRQIVADERVIAYLVSRMERSLDAARRIVARLDDLALARQSKISRQLAAEVLAEFDGGGHDASLS
jgi:chromosomal replication initiation ATPase DnaA